MVHASPTSRLRMTGAHRARDGYTAAGSARGAAANAGLNTKEAAARQDH